MKNNRHDRERLEQLNQEYHEVSMTEKQVNEMKRRMEEAKREKKREKKGNVSRKRFGYRGWAAAAALAVFILLPNTSAEVAYAMSNIPVVGRLVEAGRFRN